MGKYLLVLLLGAATAAAPTPAPVFTPGQIISQPDLVQPLGKEWSVARGTWTPAAGVLTAHEIPAQKHIPVLHLKTGPTSLIWTCEFRLGDTPKPAFLVGCDGPGHVGRVIVMPASVAIAENAPDPVTHKATNVVLTKQVIALNPDDWQKLRVEYAGDKIAVQLNGTALEAEHPYLATPKKQWWFAAKEGVEIRAIKIVAGPAPSAPVAKP